MSRTILVTPSWQVSIWNGVARLSESVAEALSMLGRDVIVITPQIINGGPLRRSVAGIQVLEVNDMPKGSWKANVPQAINCLRGVEEAIVIDSVSWIAAKDVLAEKGIPVIGIVIFGQSVQGEKIASPKTDALIVEEDEFIRNVDRLLVNNEILRTRIVTSFNREVDKLEMAASYAPETEYIGQRSGIVKESGLIVTVGKIAPELGVEKIIRVMTDLPWIKLKVIGMPRSDWEMKRMAFLLSRLHLEDRVEFLGHQRTRDVLTLIKQAEFLVTPSLVEYFGYSVMDAMIMRTPVIASTANVHIELIEDGDSGMLFQNLEELKYALNTMHETKELKNTYVERSSYLINHVRTIETMASSLAALVGV